MKLENSFTVPVPADVAWRVLLDVEQVAPCMPGATLTGRDGDNFTGTVKVKVGPVSLTYGGSATFDSLDEASRTAVIEASGKETRGSGTAKAVITTTLTESNGSTRVDVETDLMITGKPAQFGRGVMTEISGRLIDQFAECLATTITADGAPPAEAATESAGSPSDEESSTQAAAAAEGSSAPQAATSRPAVAATAERPTPEAIDLIGTAGLPVLKRIAPLALVALILFLVFRRRRR